MTISVERIELLVTLNDDATDAALGGVYRTTVAYDLGTVANVTNVTQTQMTAIRAAVLAEFKKRRDALITEVKNPKPAPVVDPATAAELRIEKRQQLRDLLTDLDNLEG